MCLHIISFLTPVLEPNYFSFPSFLYFSLYRPVHFSLTFFLKNVDGICMCVEAREGKVGQYNERALLTVVLTKTCFLESFACPACVPDQKNCLKVIVVSVTAQADDLST